MALSERVSVAVSREEKRALSWIARRDLLQRYPGSKPAKRPGAGAVLRKMSVAQAVEAYQMAKAAGLVDSAVKRTGVEQTT